MTASSSRMDVSMLLPSDCEHTATVSPSHTRTANASMAEIEANGSPNTHLHRKRVEGKPKRCYLQALMQPLDLPLHRHRAAPLLLKLMLSLHGRAQRPPSRQPSHGA
eukprot:3412784-Rhodomonas_salina.10